jgi:hypothetical protein
MFGGYVLTSAAFLIIAQPNKNTQNSNLSATPTPTPAKVVEKPKWGCSMPNVTVPTAQPVQRSQSSQNGMTVENAENMAKSVDWDCDGISNYDDNCDNTYNPSQKDSNKNGVGDACEPTTQQVQTNQTVTDSTVPANQKTDCTMSNSVTTQASTPPWKPSGGGRFHHDIRTSASIIAIAKHMDADCDRVSNYDDNCRQVFNPKQEDRNKNGIGDACETKKRLPKRNRKPRS